MHNDTVARSGEYSRVVMSSVDRVHTDPVPRKFWRAGKLIVNRAHQHPYQDNFPSEYKSVDRWFLLDTDPGPQYPMTLDTKIPVFSLALVLDEKPNPGTAAIRARSGA
jgi:hypothetical protein